MKRILIALAACLTVLSGCNGKLSGEMETNTIGVPCTFATLQVKGNVHVQVNAYANVVTVTADKNIVDLVKVKGNGKKLSIDATNRKLSAVDRDAITVQIPISRKLNYVNFNGSSLFEFPELVMYPNVKFESKGSNVFNGILTLESIIIRTEGSEEYDIDLNCDSIRLYANGSSVVGTPEHPLMADAVEVDLQGSTVAHVSACGKCSGTVDGNSELYGYGDFSYGKVKTLASGKVFTDYPRK